MRTSKHFHRITTLECIVLTAALFVLGAAGAKAVGPLVAAHADLAMSALDTNAR